MSLVLVVEKLVVLDDATSGVIPLNKGYLD